MCPVCLPGCFLVHCDRQCVAPELDVAVFGNVWCWWEEWWTLDCSVLSLRLWWIGSRTDVTLHWWLHCPSDGPSETYSLPFSTFSASFWFLLILSFFYTISGLFLPCHHASGRSVIPARRTLTHCKQSRSQRHKLHTILLAFKRLE